MPEGVRAFDFSRQYVAQIVDGRTSNYYSGTAAVSSDTAYWPTDSLGPSVAALARLDCAVVPLPAAAWGGMVLLGGPGPAKLLRRRKA